MQIDEKLTKYSSNGYPWDACMLSAMQMWASKDMDVSGKFSPQLSALCDMIGMSDMGDNTMSFVGIVLNKDVVIGFGDTKSTEELKDGTMREDFKHEPMQKVFANDFFVAAISDTNVFYAPDAIYLAEWFKEHIHEYDRPCALMHDLFNEIRIDPEAYKHKYSLLFGGADDKGLFVERHNITYGRLGTDEMERADENGFLLSTSGAYYYVNEIASGLFAQYLRERINADLTDPVKEYVTEQIKTADKSGVYNPAGGRIDVLAIKPRIIHQKLLPEGMF